MLNVPALGAFSTSHLRRWSLTLAATIGVSGCGGDSNGSSGGTPSSFEKVKETPVYQKEAERQSGKFDKNRARSAAGGRTTPYPGNR
jgi:hypothetical protein